MADEFKYNLVFESTATGNGASETATGIKLVTFAQKESEEASKRFLTAAEAEVAEVNRLVESARKRKAATDELTSSIFKQQSAEQAASSAADVVEAKSRLSARNLSVKAGEIRNLGGVAQNVGYQVTDFAVQVQSGQSVLTAFVQQAPQAIGAIGSIGLSAATAGSLISASIPAITAIGIIVTALAVSFRVLAGGYGEMKSAQDGYTKSVERGKEQLVFMREQQQKLQAEVREEFLLSAYKREADELERQETALKRINALRGELNSLEVEAATQEVQAAKSRGGDVAVAEANLLAVKLKAGVDKLQGNLAAVQQAATTAQQNSEAALAAYNSGIRQNLDPDKITELATKVDDASQAAADANQAVADQTVVFQAAKTNLVRGAEEDLFRLEKELGPAVSAVGKKALDGVYESFKTVLADGPQAAISAIRADVSNVTQAATDKNAQVASNLAGAAATINQSGSEIASKAAANSTSLAEFMSQLSGSMAGLNGNINSLIGLVTQLQATVTNQAGQIRALQSRAK